MHRMSVNKRYRTSSRTFAVVVAVAVGLSLASCGDDGDTTASSTTTADVLFPGNCSSGQQQEPLSVVVTCADSGITVSNIQWESWGAGEASGTGTAHVNDCDPDCVAGEIVAYEDAELTLSAIEQCEDGPQYTRAELTFTGDSPPGGGKPVRESFPCP